MSKLVNLTIDGKELAVEKGTTLLTACRQLDINIPTLCHMKELAPDGSCRLCVVEVEGGRKGGLPTSCSEECKEGMVIHSRSSRVIEARRFVLDLLLSNHMLDCFRCAENGNCKLQEYCLEYGVENTSFVRGQRLQPGHADTSSPFFTFYPERCIMCRKCTRTCAELQGRDVIAVSNRGFKTQMSPSYALPWRESICESCGNCVANCPTGALSNKGKEKNYREYEVQERVLTTCPHCATGCQYNLLVKNNKIVGVEATDGPSNSGLLCVKGRYGSYKFVHSGDRITQPMIKNKATGQFEPASWDEALSLIAEKFKGIQKEYGNDSIAGFSCSRAPNEDNYLFQKMMRTAFHTNNVDNCARVCHSASVHGLALTLGSGAMTNPIKDITTDVDAILMVGSNATEAHPVVGAQIRAAVRKGAKLIVVDPRKIDLAKQADIHLQLRPGTNVAFANGMVNVIISEGLADMDYINERTEGFEKLSEIVKDYTPERVAEICGIDAEQLKEAARIYAKATKAPLIYCLGVTEHSTGTEGVMSMSNIAMSVGKIGKSGCGVNPLRGQNNVQGACDMGAMPYHFPGYQLVENDDIRGKFEKAWGTTLPTNKGLMATEALPLAGKDIRGLYIFGEDPVVSDPDTNAVVAHLKALDFFVLQELFMTETAAYADVVLPGMSYAEKEGTFSNTERRVQRVRKAVSLEGDMRLDTDIFADVMTRMGYKQETLSAEAIMDEIASVTPSFAGINHRRLDAGETLQWPCLDETSKGTYFLHEGKFSRGLGWFYPSVYKKSQELPDEQYPTLLVTGRELYHYNAGAMTHRAEDIMEISGESYIEIHQEDAGKIGVKDGDRVKVSSRRGKIETNARVGDKVNPQEAFMTFHFPDGNANYLTNAALDDIARIPEYKVCAIKVEKV